MPRSICKIEKIQSKNRNGDKKHITENMIPELDDMLSSEPSAQEHPNTKSNSNRKIILTSYDDSNKTPDKPKYTHGSRESLRHKCWKLDDKSIVEIIPHTRSSNKHISKNIETKKSNIIKIFSFF